MNFLTVKIDPTSNGIIVKVGCIKLVYQQTQLNVFHNDLALYLNDPLAAEKEVRERWNMGPGEDSESPVEATEPRDESSKISQVHPVPEREVAEKEKTEGEAPR